ncbi:MAG: hypothetical protein V3V03_07100, partial [Hyphomonadaceae bacterium]
MGKFNWKPEVNQIPHPELVEGWGMSHFAHGYSGCARPPRGRRISAGTQSRPAVFKPAPFDKLRMRLLVVLFSLVALSSPAAAQTLTPLTSQPEDVAWPTESWETGGMPEGSAEAVTALIEDAMGRELSDVMGETRGVVIIHQGRLVAEAYREGFDPETKQISWSMAKSVTHALVGRAVHLGLIEDIDAAMPSPFAEDDPRRLITWRQWLNMTDGLDYHEIDAGDDLENNDVVQMMFGTGRFDVIQYVVDELPPI